MSVPDLVTLNVSDIFKHGVDLFSDRIEIGSPSWVDAYHANISDIRGQGVAYVLQIPVRNKSNVLIENVGASLILKGEVTEFSYTHDHDHAELSRLEEKIPLAKTGELRADFSPRDMWKLNVLVVKNRGDYSEIPANTANSRYEVSIPETGNDLGNKMASKFRRKKTVKNRAYHDVGPDVDVDLDPDDLPPEWDQESIEEDLIKPGVGPTVDALYNMEYETASIKMVGGRGSSDGCGLSSGPEKIDLKEALSFFQES